jgi:hypothetical protein
LSVELRRRGGGRGARKQVFDIGFMTERQGVEREGGVVIRGHFEVDAKGLGGPVLIRLTIGVPKTFISKVCGDELGCWVASSIVNYRKDKDDNAIHRGSRTMRQTRIL